MKSNQLSSSIIFNMGGVKNAREAIVDLLSTEWPLSAKQVFSRISGNGVELTYQAVHKAIVGLEQEKIVLKGEKGYLLNSSWLYSTARALNKTISLYEGEKFEPFSGQKIESASSMGSLLLLKHYLSNKQFSMTRDQVLLLGHRFCMSPVSLYLQWAKQLSGPKGKNVIYYSCRALSKAFHGGLKEKGISKHLEGELKFKADTLCFAGWGEVFFGAIDLEKKTASVTMNFSPVAEDYAEINGKSKFPVDDAVRGFLCGLFVVAFDDPSIECVETACRACGAEKCVFEIKSRKSFNSANRVVKRQLAK